MPLESATYVSGLNSSNPVSGDGVSAGDDHIRLVKQTLANSFPAVSGAVTASHTELNHTDGVTSNIQTQLNAKAATGHGHAISDTTGLQAALDAKQANTGTITRSSLQDVLTHSYSGHSYNIYIASDGNMGAWDNNNDRSVYTFNIGTRNAYFYGSVNSSGLIYGNGGGAGLGRITVSTSDPSGGSDGDIWFKVA
jgi:uncharacterized protein YwbE